jgi:hypothetical protein
VAALVDKLRRLVVLKEGGRDFLDELRYYYGML